METERIASYTLQYEIGSGGMSKVYYAVNSLNDPFAIKTLHSDLIHHETIRKRFRNEMEALKSLRDIEQVCQIKDYFEDGQQMAIVMEYLSGVDLLKYSRRNGPIPPRQLIGWMQDLLPAFVACHARKIIHRDVKPSNFFLTDAGKLKILDFGIAKALDQTEAQLNSMAQGLTSFQEVIGSPMYMSPEQVRGLRQIDHRSDIYSVGVMMYTLLSGQNPYEGLSITSNFDIQESVVKQPLPNLTGGLAVFNPLIQRATQKDPADRYQSVQTLLNDLDALASDMEPVAAVSVEPEIQVTEEPMAPPPPLVRLRMPVPEPDKPVPVKPAAVQPATAPAGNRLLLVGALLLLLIGGLGYGFRRPLLNWLQPVPAVSSVAATDETAGTGSQPGEAVPVSGSLPDTETQLRVREVGRLLATLELLPSDDHPALFAQARQTLLKLSLSLEGESNTDSLYAVCAANGARLGLTSERNHDPVARRDAIGWYRTAYVLRPDPALLTQIAGLQRTSVGIVPKVTKPARKARSGQRSSSPFALDPEVTH